MSELFMILLLNLYLVIIAILQTCLLSIYLLLIK